MGAGRSVDISGQREPSGHSAQHKVKPQAGEGRLGRNDSGMSCREPGRPLPLPATREGNTEALVSVEGVSCAVSD